MPIPTPASATATTLTGDEWVLAERFADEWDQKAFDPAYDTLPLEHFEPLVRRAHREGADVAPVGPDGFRRNQSPRRATLHTT